MPGSSRSGIARASNSISGVVTSVAVLSVEILDKIEAEVVLTDVSVSSGALKVVEASVPARSGTLTVAEADMSVGSGTG